MFVRPVNKGSKKRSWQGVDLLDAYDQMSPPAFAIWIRLMFCTDKELESGLKTLSKKFKYSRGRLRSLLNELRMCGFVKLYERLEHDRSPIHIEIKKRAILDKNNRFIRL